MSDDFFQKAHELRSAGVPFVTATVVRVERPTSGKPGDRAIVTLDGHLYGWIGGSCAQPTVLREAARALEDGTPRLLRLSPEPGTRPVAEGVEEVPMTCFSGGTLDIFIEPHQPALRLLVVGTRPVAQALAQLGKAMGYEVVAVDPTGDEAISGADEVIRDLAEIPSRVHPLTFAVVTTHGEYDEPALRAILGTTAPYVALVASRTRGEAVLSSLAQDGVDEATRKRVRFPAGLDIKARRGDEIAVSILAEIIQTRRSLGVVSWDAAATASQSETGTGNVSAMSTAGTASTETAEQETAIDPICLMTVQVEGALHTYEYLGRMYYFCCGGCRTRFMAEPEKYSTTG